MKFIKKNSKYIGIVMICIFCSYLTTIATNYIFDSSDVRFDNTGTSLESVNVQDAIDETFHHVTDYNEIKTTIGNSTLTTTNKTLIGAINEVNSNLNPAKTTILSGTNVTSDTFILSLTDGCYPVAISGTNQGYLPEKYGTLIVNKAGRYYGSFTFVSSIDSATYVRHADIDNSTWASNWQELATSSNLGSPSSASGVSGADAFSKINTLNGNIADVLHNITSLFNGSVAANTKYSLSDSIANYRALIILTVTDSTITKITTIPTAVISTNVFDISIISEIPNTYSVLARVSFYTDNNASKFKVGDLGKKGWSTCTLIIYGAK